MKPTSNNLALRDHAPLRDRTGHRFSTASWRVSRCRGGRPRRTPDVVAGRDPAQVPPRPRRGRRSRFVIVVQAARVSATGPRRHTPN